MSLCKKVMLFLFAVFLFIYPSPVRAQHVEPKICLEGQKDSALGLFILKIMLYPQNTKLCGLEFDITYDPSALILCSCERGGALSTLEFDCSLDSGRIRLLLWGEANSAEGGRIATICFLPVESFDGEIEFILSLPTKSSAIYFEDNQILSRKLLLEGLRVEFDMSEQSTQSTTDLPTENSTEIPSTSEQEHPSTEQPTEENTDKTELETNTPSESENKPPAKSSIFKKILSVLLCVNTGASVICLLPMLLPSVFRKGYF